MKMIPSRSLGLNYCYIKVTLDTYDDYWKRRPSCRVDKNSKREMITKSCLSKRLDCRPTYQRERDVMSVFFSFVDFVVLVTNDHLSYDCVFN